MSAFTDWSYRVHYLAAVWRKLDFFATNRGRSAYCAWEGEWDGKDGAW
jgi:hypothetical protein